MNLGCLWFTCHLLDVLCCSFWAFHFLGQLSDLACRNFFKSLLLSLMIFDTVSSSLRKKKRNIPLCRILAVSCGYFARLIWACTALYHSSTEQYPCLKVVNRSNFALTSFVCGLENTSNVVQMTSMHKSSRDRHQDTYWSIPKLPDQAITSLHFLVSANIASSHSYMFSHFNFHFRNWL